MSGCEGGAEVLNSISQIDAIDPYDEGWIIRRETWQHPIEAASA
jgi:hypothetical protein